ncbi:MAG: hypothetical protein ABIZ95_03995, partial [Pyrinomonadaceae bacterium]
MRKLIVLLVMIGLTCIFPAVEPTNAAVAATAPQDGNQTSVPQNRKRPHKYEGRRRHRGIGRAYGKAGKSAALGGRDFYHNMRHGKPIKASRRLGKGMGGFGKHTGQGTLRTGR